MISRIVAVQPKPASGRGGSATLAIWCVVGPVAT
jgi:hypothetical protein